METSTAAMEAAATADASAGTMETATSAAVKPAATVLGEERHG